MRKKRPSNFQYLEANEIRARVLAQSYLLLKIRPRSEKEIEQRLKYYLQMHNIENNMDIVNDVIKSLKESKLIDDVSFTRFWIESKVRGKPKGKLIIVPQLLQKGINKELIEEELAKITADYPEEELIRKLVTKAEDKYRGFSGFEKRQKIIRYVVARGFSYDKTCQVIDETSKKT